MISNPNFLDDKREDQNTNRRFDALPFIVMFN